MRKISVIFAMLILTSFIYAIDYTPISTSTNPTGKTQLTDQEIQTQNSLTLINQKLTEVATTKTVNDNFTQLDTALKDLIKMSSLTIVGLVVGIIILNDLLLLSILAIIKSKGYM